MGRLERGKWILEDVIPPSEDGEFVRQNQAFRDRIEASGPYPPASGRYHLYVSYACPWAHRTLIMRALKGLEEVISVSVVSPLMGEDGWTFSEDFPGVVPDKLFGKSLLREIYVLADPKFSGKVTVPVLFDRETRKIVNNESEEVLRILNSGFKDFATNSQDFYPSELRQDIDQLNERIYHDINNGVYKAGFARKQDVYEKHVNQLFETLDRMDLFLETKDYLVGDRLTEADIRFFTTLVRFDAVYHGHFKCNKRMIREYRNLSRYLRGLYEIPAFKMTTHFDHIKHHYYRSHPSVNPSGVVPAGPDRNLV